MNREEIDKIDRMCREKFTYSVTNFNLLHWRSHRLAVEAHQPWTGPCGDLTSTVLDFITAGGHPLEQCYRLLVSIDGAAKPDHIVGCVHTNDAGYLIVGDTTRAGAYTAHAMSHRPMDFNRLSEAGEGGQDPLWREGVPWA